MPKAAALEPGDLPATIFLSEGAVVSPLTHHHRYKRMRDMQDHDIAIDIDFTSLKTWRHRKSLGQHVFDTLKQAIIQGNLASGQRLVESRIAEMLDLSRTPVREAMHKLEREGFLKKLPRGGFVVLGLSRNDIEETFGIRSVLESYAARLAAEKHAPEELDGLQLKIDEYQTQLDGGDLAELPRINTEFHDLLYAMSRSPRLVKMINDLRDQIFRFRQIILKQEDMARESNRDHRLMLRHIARRDGEGVEVLVRDHILRGRAVVLRDWDRDH